MKKTIVLEIKEEGVIRRNLHVIIVARRAMFREIALVKEEGEVVVAVGEIIIANMEEEEGVVSKVSQFSPIIKDIFLQNQFSKKL